MLLTAHNGINPAQPTEAIQDGSRRSTTPGEFVPKRYAHVDGYYWGTPPTCDALEPGFYEPLDGGMRGPMLRKMAMKTDNLLRLPDPTCDMLLKEFCDFWEKSPEMTRRGLSVKRGLMLYGPPGSGKTSALQIMAHHMIREMNGVVIMVNEPHLTAAALGLFRAIEPERPVILVYEDIDALVNRYSESGLLALLDGELQISGVVNVATTNYPELLDRRFTDRPGRFDRITLVGMPLAPARRAYFDAKASEQSEALRQKWTDASEGWSLAHLRELIVAHLVLGEPDDDVIERLTSMRETRPNSEHAEERVFGFGEVRRTGFAPKEAARIGRAGGRNW